MKLLSKVNEIGIFQPVKFYIYIYIYIRIIADEEQKSDQDIVTEVKIKTGEDIEPSDVEMVEHIAQAIGENKALNLVESDLELISLISDSKSEKEAKKGGFPVKNQDHTPDISQKEAEFLSEVVNIFGTHVAPGK